MEPLSTSNFGASLAQQSRSFPLKDLATRARQLSGIRNGLEGINSNGPKSQNIGQEVSTANKDKSKELMEVAKKFEAILIHQMLKAMRQTVHKSDLLNSFSLQQYESMMDEEIASEMSKQKGIGLADSLFYQLSRLDKASNPPATISNNSLRVNQYE
jgi:Rod binding domain-containing protein